MGQQQQTAYHGYQGPKASANQYRGQERQREHRAGEAAKLRRRADAMNEDISWLIGQLDVARGKYGPTASIVREGEVTVARLMADQRALYTRANAMERPGA